MEIQSSLCCYLPICLKLFIIKHFGVKTLGNASSEESRDDSSENFQLGSKGEDRLKYVYRANWQWRRGPISLDSSTHRAVKEGETTAQVERRWCVHILCVSLCMYLCV